MYLFVLFVYLYVWVHELLCTMTMFVQFPVEAQNVAVSGNGVLVLNFPMLLMVTKAASSAMTLSALPFRKSLHSQMVHGK